MNKYDIAYFGSAPDAYEQNPYSYTQVCKYYENYLHKLTRTLNPEFKESSVRNMVYEVVSLIIKNYIPPKVKIAGINSKLAFYTVIKLVEKSMILKKMKLIYLKDSGDNLPQLIKEFDVNNIIAQAENNGLYDITPLILSEDLKWKYMIGYTDLTLRPQRKREIKVKAKNDDFVDALKDKLRKKYRKEEEEIKEVMEQKVSFPKRVKVEDEYEDANIDDVNSYSSDESHALTEGLNDVIMETRYL